MKKPLLSVIVPTRNSEATIGACLKSVKSQTYKNLEIIIVDNNSLDNTKKIARQFTELIFNKGPERSAQRNYGAANSKGNYLLFIDSDMILEEKVAEDCIKVSTDKNIGAVIIPEESFGKGFWAKCKALERSFYLRVDWIEAVRFIPKRVFNEFHGFDENLVSAEDWDLNQRIKKKYKISRIDSFIKHDEGSLSLIQLLRKKMYYGSQLRNYSSKKENSQDFKSQSSVIKRYRLFFADPKKLFTNPSVGLGMLFMKTCEFMSMALGYVLKS